MNPKYDEYFLEAVVGFSGTDDTESMGYKDAILTLESKGKEKLEYLNSMVEEISKWTKSATPRNQEIFDTNGDITKFEPDLMEVCRALERSYGNGEAPNSQIDSNILTKARALYTHFNMHKKLYIDAFKTDNKTVKTVYVAGTWLLISYLSAACVYFTGHKFMNNPDLKFGKMISDLHKIISHPKYVEYMTTAERAVLHSESLLYESAIAIGTTIVSMIVVLRLIIWNIYTMRTKLSDKLKVTAEFLEKNATRVKNTGRKDAEKIATKQLKIVDSLNRAAEKLRIKMDDDTVTKPTPASNPKRPSSEPIEDEDDMDDFEL